MKRPAAPSSTIKAATLAGLTMGLVWGTVNEFTDLNISAQYISLTTTFVSTLVGYLQPEKVLPLRDAK